MSSGYDYSLTYYWGLWKIILMPHEFHRFREDRFMNFTPDSRLQSVTVTLNRQNTFYDHFWRGTGYDNAMG